MADTAPFISTQILIIDDDQLVRDFAVHTIEYGTNRKVMTYDNGFQAWQFINAHPDQVDIIIADANIPEMNGLALLERVKKSYPQKIVILTAGDPETESLANQLNADGFISKPFDADVLFTVVRQFGHKPDLPIDTTVTDMDSKRNRDKP